MHYEHLVQINDPADPRVPPLTREQLWLGLVARAERPQYFLIGMDECRIVEHTGNALRREMQFGKTLVRDRVTYEPSVQIRFDVEPTAESGVAQMIMRIEEPQPGVLFVRFVYDLQSVTDDAVGDADEFRKSAYREADVDTVQMIRQFAASGLLSADGPADISEF